MKKNARKGYAILGVLFVLVSVIVIVVPSVKTKTFWVIYAFTVIAFAIQLIIWKISLGSSKSLKGKFFRFSLIYIGIIYLIIQISMLAVFLIFPTLLSVWSTVTVCGMITGIAVICMIFSSVGGAEIERVSVKVRKKIFYIKQLQDDIEILTNEEIDVVTKTALKQLSEKIRFSDPTSDEHLADLEKEIIMKIAKLKSSESKTEIINELNSLLDERNRKIKILK